MAGISHPSTSDNVAVENPESGAKVAKLSQATTEQSIINSLTHRDNETMTNVSAQLVHKASGL